jgi:hypothetical protein
MDYIKYNGDYLRYNVAVVYDFMVPRQNGFAAKRKTVLEVQKINLSSLFVMQV